MYVRLLAHYNNLVVTFVSAAHRISIRHAYRQVSIDGEGGGEERWVCRWGIFFFNEEVTRRFPRDVGKYVNYVIYYIIVHTFDTIHQFIGRRAKAAGRVYVYNIIYGSTFYYGIIYLYCVEQHYWYPGIV